MPKQYWLVKSEPSTWSWEMQVKAGAKGTRWDGVRNHTAKNNLKAMQKGDLALFYHSGEDKAVMGIVEVTRAHYPDPTAEKGEPWIVVDLKNVKPLKKPVTLAQVKAEKKLAAMALVRTSRLSVQPVTEAEWRLILKMGGL